MNDLKYWVALSRIPSLGAARFRRLEAYFGDFSRVWQASLSDLKAAGLEEKPAQDTLKVRAQVDPDAELERNRRAGVSVLTWRDPGYPPRLKEIPDPPPTLFVKGELRPSDERAVAVVGTRSPTAYGREAAARLTADLARNGLTIVSGLARGIDAIAHQITLDAGGRTIAVLASGLDIVYPKEHARLFQAIQQQGAVVSEYPLGTRPDARHFPRRNRLISGLSLGALVVEAAEGSGALWTVYHALEQDREVFCVPGSIFSPASRATNRLIQEGAKLAATCADVLEELNLTTVAHQPELPLLAEAPVKAQPATAAKPGPAQLAAGDAPETALLRHIGEDPLHIDDIRRLAGLPINQVSSLLTLLEIQGQVRQVGCMHYIRAREATSAYGD